MKKITAFELEVSRAWKVIEGKWQEVEYHGFPDNNILPGEGG